MYICEHVLFVPLRAFYLGRSTRQTFAGRIILLGDDHDLGRRSWSWRRIMILADDHDPARPACSCWNSMILVENKEPAFRDHLGTPQDHLRATSGPFSAEFHNSFPSVSGPVWGQICIISERGTKKTHSLQVSWEKKVPNAIPKVGPRPPKLGANVPTALKMH